LELIPRRRTAPAARIWRRSGWRRFRCVQLELLAAGARSVRFAAAKTICRQNDPGIRLFVVARGRVKLAIERAGAVPTADY